MPCSSTVSRKMAGSVRPVTSAAYTSFRPLACSNAARNSSNPTPPDSISVWSTSHNTSVLTAMRPASIRRGAGHLAYAEAMPAPADIPIGERVRFYPQARRKTQAVVAGLAGITEDYLSQIERGRKTPSTALLHRLARALGVPTSVLFGESRAEAATPGHPLSAAINTALASRGAKADNGAADLA